MIFTASLFSKKQFLLFELLFMVILPVLLVRLSPTFLFFRHAVMGFLLVYVAWIIKKINLPIRFRRPPPLAVLWKSSILPSLLLAGIIAPLVIRFPEVMYIEEIDLQNQWFPRFFPPLFYALISVPLQEFIFRAFYIERLSRVVNQPWLVVLVSALVFGFVHVVFKNPFFPFVTAVLGIWWGYLYLKYRCFWPCVISHAFLGILTLSLAIYFR